MKKLSKAEGRNGLLRNKMDEFGIKTLGELSSLSGLNYTLVRQAFNLQAKAYNLDGSSSRACAGLCEVFGCTPEEIFPQETLFANPKVNKLMPQWGSDMLGRLSAFAVDKIDHKSIEDCDAVRPLLETPFSDERLRNILCLSYGLEGVSALSLDDIGARYNITRERVRQLLYWAESEIREAHA